MGVKRTTQVQNLEDVQSLLLHLGSCHVFPGMLKRRIFSPAEKAGWLSHTRTPFTVRGKGWRCGKQGAEDLPYCIWMVFQKLESRGCCSSWAGLWKPSGRSGEVSWLGITLDVHLEGWWQKLPLVVVLRLWKVLSFCQTLLLQISSYSFTPV